VLGLVSALYSRTMIRALVLSGLAIAILCGVSVGKYETDNTHLLWLSVLIPVAAVLATMGVRGWHRKPVQVLAQRSRSQRPMAGRLMRVGKTWNRTWYQLLEYATTRQSVTGRTAAVIFWQECRAAIAFSLVVLPLAALSIAGTALFRNWFLPTHVILCVVVIECGLRTFRRDQQKLNGLFWSHRGVSPGLVWCLHVATWFATMLVLLISVVLIEFVIVLVMQSRLHSEFKWASVLATFDTHSRSADLQWMPIFEGFTAGAIGAFAIAQLVSRWERKPLVAGLLALICVTMFGSWIGYVLSFGMPLLLLVWPLAAGRTCICCWFYDSLSLDGSADWSSPVLPASGSRSYSSRHDVAPVTVVLGDRSSVQQLGLRPHSVYQPGSQLRSEWIYRSKRNKRMGRSVEACNRFRRVTAGRDVAAVA